MEENILAFSSVGRRRLNADGSVNVYCRVCKNFICSVSAATMISSSAICSVCEAFGRGEIITKEQEDELRIIRMPDGRELPRALFVDKTIEDPVTGQVQSDKDMITANTLENWFRAVTKKFGVKKKKRKKTQSVEVAQEKKPSRLFDGGIIFNLDLKDKDGKKE